MAPSPKSRGATRKLFWPNVFVSPRTQKREKDGKHRVNAGFLARWGATLVVLIFTGALIGLLLAGGVVDQEDEDGPARGSGGLFSASFAAPLLLGRRGRILVDPSSEAQLASDTPSLSQVHPLPAWPENPDQLTHPRLTSERGPKQPTLLSARPPAVTTPYSFRIYVYDDVVPVKLDRGLRQRKVECAGKFGSAEGLFPDLAIGTNVFTRDPELADFYLVPIQAGCYVEDALQRGVALKDALGQMNKLLEQAIDAVQTQHPYWHRTEGRDHIFPFASEHGTSIVKEEALLSIRKSIFLMGPTPRDLKAPFFDTWKDVLLPLPSRKHAEHSQLQVPTLNEDTGEHRPYLVWFHAGANQHLTPAEDYTLADMLEETLEIARGEGVAVGRRVEDMQKSKFCICAKGAERWSECFQEAVEAGCIPIIICDSMELPFEASVDYSTFTVKVLEKDARELVAVLKRLPEEALRAKQEALASAWDIFQYHSHWQQGDAFDEALKELAKRVRFLRNSSNRFWETVQDFG